jgi:SAM-dependent methyltransferase
MGLRKRVPVCKRRTLKWKSKNMSAAQQPFVPAPFDAVALQYDDTFTSSAVGRAQRLAVWKELAKLFRPGDRVLEIGCGTGEDACFLAQRGVRVTACDSSSRMIAVTRRKIAGYGLQKLVNPVEVGAEHICNLSTSEPFHGAFSNFGVLNCVPDLGRLAKDLASLLNPNAHALLCWMGPTCIWEIAWYLAHGDREKAFRRLQPDGITARLAAAASVHVRYPSVRSLAQTFAPHFRVKSVVGVGVAVPPSYAEAWAQRHPNWLRFCEGVDGLLGKSPGIRLLGDHVLVRLQRTPVQA